MKLQQFPVIHTNTELSGLRRDRKLAKVSIKHLHTHTRLHTHTAVKRDKQEPKNQIKLVFFYVDRYTQTTLAERAGQFCSRKSTSATPEQSSEQGKVDRQHPSL